METIPSVLACDVGNSTIRLACVKGETVSDSCRFKVGRLSSLGEKLKELWNAAPEPKMLLAGSVNPTALKALEAAAAEALNQKVLLVGQDIPLPLPTDLPEPQSIGVDRICCAAAAYDQIGEACVVADFGTAITIDCVSDEGTFLGGAILPGLAMGMKALHAGTAQLPIVELSNPEWVFGKNARQAIVGGLVFGARGALREIVESYATKLGRWPLVVATGGDAKLICGEGSASQLVQTIVEDMVLRGVAIAYYKTLVK